MKYIFMITIFFTSFLFSQELKVIADAFETDQAKGFSTFEGHVNIIKKSDELNASKLTIYTDEKNQPTKFIALGNVSFKIQTKEGARYTGTAGKVIYLPKESEYHFYKNVYLKQVDEKKEIQGDEVILNTVNGKAHAKGLHKEPVIMIFNIADDTIEEKK
ncbi:lipopolysaccharide transport periplasmic protein LptA [Sulfurimonas sp. SAG-AH-194-C21]|nr:lipopolysaccharide transport periplasmic protein LptA [Sulfurimonas sp. SAG-AH-194-C21]MDF1883796.1 lipopolysaccharide transport periplasmic protein LptA [Sulfurimonas sp. SAG-AH-194-C21]